MGGRRSTHINRVRTHAARILGPGFQQDWFAPSFDRTSISKLEELAGAQWSAGGKKYNPFPPIFFLNPEIEDKKDLFLNPALIAVSTPSFQPPTTSSMLTNYRLQKFSCLDPRPLIRRRQETPLVPRLWEPSGGSRGLPLV